MTLQLAVSTRDARLDAIEADLGVSPILELRTGSPPADCATADSGVLVASMALPSDFMSAATAGAKAKSGTWSDPAADAAGTVGHFRLKTSGGVCKIQGTVTITGGGGDMTLDNDVVTINQLITITSFTLTDGNA